MENDKLIQFEPILLEFERAWRNVTRTHRASLQRDPEAVMVLPSVEKFSQYEGRLPPMLWDELTRIDLEHRLRHQHAIISDEYQDHLMRLDSEEGREDLLRYEFEIRQRFNRRPSQSELNRRFGDGCGAVSKLLPDDVGKPHKTIATAKDESVAGKCITDIAALLVAGTVVNQYSIESQIGVGAFAIVYVAMDRTLGRRVALKFLRPRVSQIGSVRERMLREAQAVAGLRHPNIVPIFETGRFQNHDFIVSQYVAGQDLETTLVQKQFNTNESVELIRQLAHAIEHAHQNGVVHRDIKPANIMLDSDGHPLLLDFGLAHLGDASIQLTNAGDLVGTPAYMPPEQADGRAWQADPRSDVYSLGAILFQLICGRLPFEGTTAQVIQNVIYQPAPSPRRIKSGIDRDLQTIILKCLEKEPSDRYQTGIALADDLKNYSMGKSIVARPVGLGGRALKWSRRKPLFAALLASLLLALSFVVGFGTQLRTVSMERDRAIHAEQKSRLAEIELEHRLATEAAAAGRLAMQRGQLAQAILFFENSLVHGYENSIDLHFLKLSAFVAIRETEKANDELQLISAVLESPAEEGRKSREGDLLIWKAELALDGHTEWGDPVDLFERASEQTLDEASRDYVSAMLASESLDSLAFFRAVLANDHFHHRARRMLVTMLISLGRLEDAETETNIAIELFPEDQDFQLFKSLLLAHRGRLDLSDDCLAQANLEESDTETWRQFCKLMDHVSNHLVIYPGRFGYREKAINELAEKFATTCLPAIRQRGWHFPPRIGAKIEGLPGVLSERVTPAAISDIVNRLRKMVEVHPEGSLYSILSERLITQQNLHREANEEEFKSVNAELIIESLKATEQAIRTPAIVSSAHEAAWTSVYANAVSLALIYEIDVAENSKRAIEAARKIEVSDVIGIGALKGLTIGLLKMKEYEEAERFANAWAERTKHRDFNAVWHQLMCDRYRERWYEVMIRCNELIETFPDQPVLKDLREAAKGHLESAMDSGKKAGAQP